MDNSRMTISILFNAFLNGDMNDTETYQTMLQEFSNMQEHLQKGDLNDDDLSMLQYASMKAGFFAGIYTMKSLISA